MNISLNAEGGLSICRVAELKQAPLEQSTALDTACGRLRTQANTSAPHRQPPLRAAAHSPAVLEALELLNLVAYFGDPLIVGRCPDRTPDDFFRVAPDSAGNSTDSAYKNP